MLSRSRSHKVIAGVCAGIAQRFGISRTLVRGLFIASVILPGTQVLVYAVLWVLMPLED